MPLFVTSNVRYAANEDSKAQRAAQSTLTTAEEYVNACVWSHDASQTRNCACSQSVRAYLATINAQIHHFGLLLYKASLATTRWRILSWLP
eukprot:1825489-Pleurochrysis_carterae.AAC.19